MRSPLEVLQLYPPHGYTLPAALESRAAAGPDRPFILCEGREQSWRAFSAEVERTARDLVARGVERGDRVAVIGRNSDRHVVLLFALARLSAIMVPVNPEFGVEELRFVLGNAAVCGVFSGVEDGLVAQAMDGRDAWIAPLHAPAPVNEVLPPAAAQPDDTCLIIYTSGTTGFPKGVMHSQRNLLLAGEAFVQRVHLQETDRLMVVLPMFHMNALFYSIGGAVAAGAGLVIVPRFSASAFWQTAADTGATEVNIIEAIGSILQNRARSEYRPDHRIRAAYGVRQAAMKAFRDEFGIADLFSGFGMTEVPGVTCNPYGEAGKPGSMGVLGLHPDPAQPWAACRIVNDDGQDVPAGEVGELAVKTPILMQGYFRDPEATRSAFRDGWFMTGDLVRRDADGWFFFVSRKKDIIRRRGENIAGAELDRVVGSHPAVLEAAAIAVPSPLGEDDILIAVVRRREMALSAEDVAAWCAARLSPKKVPRYVAFLDALPHTPTHKIAKAVLRQDESLKARAIDLERAAPAAAETNASETERVTQ